MEIDETDGPGKRRCTFIPLYGTFTDQNILVTNSSPFSPNFIKYFLTGKLILSVLEHYSMNEQFLSLPLRQKVGQLFFIGIPGPTLDASTRELLTSVSPGGVCLFTRNIRDAEQTRALLDGLREELPVEPFLSVDQEGGLVDRLRRILTPMPAASKIKTKAEAVKVAEMIAEALRILGFNMNFAPVVDVVDGIREQTSNGLYSRGFGRSKDDVLELAAYFLESLQANGVIGCIKHFPGRGAASVDSHEELPSVEVSDDEMNGIDLVPFRKLIEAGNVELVMAAHATFPKTRLQETNSDGKLLPSSLSHNFITTLLRGELRFNGLAITDDLEMGAIQKNYGIGRACVMAVAAGQDQLAICAEPENIRAGFEAVVNAVEVGEISEDRLNMSLIRIAKLKSQLSDPLAFDTERLTKISTEIEKFNEYLNR